MSNKACVLCNSTDDDALQLGEKITCEDTTAHLYCLLLTSNLVQNGEDDEGISGFMPKDIKSEVWRTKKLFCFYCGGKGATIGCCLKSCRRSFHLPCALQNDCRLEFTNTFRSFCHDHHDIKKPNHVHKPTDLCTICYDEMGKYNLIQSIPLPCCNKNAWCHKLCLQKYAQTSGYFLKCPLCKDSDNFRNFIAERGVFIPDRDAKWEIDDSGPNTFYDFEQHTERPSECEAKICKCHKGRKYQVDIENDKNSLVFCHYCGSHAVHLGCFKGKEFLCEECTTIVNRARENAANTSSARSDRETNSRRSAANHGRSITQTPSIAGASGQRSENRFCEYLQTHAHLVSKFKLREFSINVRRLTAEDIGFTLEPNDSEYETANTSSETSESSDSQTDDNSSDENVNKPVSPNQKRLMVFATSNSESDTESEIEVKPAKRQRLLPRNQFFDSDSDTEMDSGTKMDINDNSTDFIVNKQPERDFLFGLRLRQFLTSEEELIRPSGSNVRKPHISDSSEDQNCGKENEKPIKSIAVVRPFSRFETSSDESVKPVRSKDRPRQQISSSDEANFSQTAVPTTPMKVEEILGEALNTHSKINATKRSPFKKKRRTVMSYFRQTSSSDEEPIESKPKRKSPKSKQRPMPEIAPNQPTINDFFKKPLHKSM